MSVKTVKRDKEYLRPKTEIICVFTPNQTTRTLKKKVAHIRRAESAGNCAKRGAKGRSAR